MAVINVVSSVLPECIHMSVYIIPRVTKIFTLSPHIKQQRNMLYNDFPFNVIIYFPIKLMQTYYSETVFFPNFSFSYRAIQGRLTKFFTLAQIKLC